RNSTDIPGNESLLPNDSAFINAGLNLANTFYWDKKAMLVTPRLYSNAVITHWLYNADNSVSGIVSSEKRPLENRVWYAYNAQPDYWHVGPSGNPTKIGRVLADGITQLSQFEYNSIGKITKTTDPKLRVMTYEYASNNIDLRYVRQKTGTNNELLRTLTYNPPSQVPLHLPVTDTDASGKETQFVYNSQGQLLSRENPKHEITTYSYGGTVPPGCLASITSPQFNLVSAVTRFTYDSYKRVHTVTSEPDQYIVTTDYDELDRKIKVTYPDTTFEEFQYSQVFQPGQHPRNILDLTASRDRLGRWTNRHYDANRKMDSITDPLGRTTLYGWCTCGSLTTIEDPNHNVTTFNRDIQSRIHQKIFADGTTINYLYEGQTAPDTA